MPLGAFKAALMGTAGATAAGDVVLLSSQTASNSASLSFTSGIDSTYGEYIFRFYNINPVTDCTAFQFQCNATDSTSYDETMTTTTFEAYTSEDGSGSALAYLAGTDQAQGTSGQSLSSGIGNAADESASGEFHLFNPASTTYVKHFNSRANFYHASGIGYTTDTYSAGYVNTTTAIDDIKFYMSSGNFDGKIKLWGVK